MASAAQEGEDENYWPGFVDALTTMVMVLTFIMMILGMTVFSLSQNVSKVLVAEIARSANVSVAPNDAPKDVVTRIVEAIVAKNEEIDRQKVRTVDGQTPRDPKTLREPNAAMAADASQAQKDSAKEGLARIGDLAATQERDVDGQQRKARAADASLSLNEKSQREALLSAPGDRTVSQAPSDMKPLQAGAAAGASEIALTIVFQPNAASFDEGVRREIAGFAARSRQGEFVIRAYAVETGGTITESRRIAYYRAMLVRQELLKAGMSPSQITVHIDDSTDAANRSLLRVFSLRKTP